MTVSASHRPNRMSYCYRLAPRRAAFVSCQHTVPYCSQCGAKIWPHRCAFHHQGEGPTCITDLFAAPCLRRRVQIPIALRFTLAMVKHPAVSSLKV